jgi:hypothetical protein
VSTPINEDEGPRALRQLGSEIDKLWEEVEREGGATVSATQAARLVEE